MTPAPLGVWVFEWKAAETMQIAIYFRRTLPSHQAGGDRETIAIAAMRRFTATDRAPMSLANGSRLAPACIEPARADIGACGRETVLHAETSFVLRVSPMAR